MSATIRHPEDLDTEIVSAGSATSRQVLTARGEGAGFHMRKFVIGPGGGMPRHRNQVEHQQYVLGGSATVGIDEDNFRVSAGDVVHIPAGTPHWYQNDGDVAFEFLCVVPDTDDRIELLG